MLECGGVGPFSECGLNEALGLAVRLRGVGPDPDVLDSELLAGAGEGFGEIAAAIVSHDAFDGNAKALEVGNGGDQECNSAFLRRVPLRAAGALEPFAKSGWAALSGNRGRKGGPVRRAPRAVVWLASRGRIDPDG